MGNEKKNDIRETVERGPHATTVDRIHQAHQRCLTGSPGTVFQSINLI